MRFTGASMPSWRSRHISTASPGSMTAAFPIISRRKAYSAISTRRKFDEIRAPTLPLNREDALEGDAQVDMAMLAPGSDSSLFNAALTAGFAAQGKRQIRSEMALVANQVLVARAIDFGDPDAVRDAIELTHHYLNLGLEHLAGGDLKTAIDYLRETHLKMLLRLGVSLTIDLRKRAEALVRSLGFAPGKVRSISYLDSPYREALEGFLLIAPRFYGRLGPLAFGGGARLQGNARPAHSLRRAGAVGGDGAVIRRRAGNGYHVGRLPRPGRRTRNSSEPDPADRVGEPGARRQRLRRCQSRPRACPKCAARLMTPDTPGPPD